jgi:hypothetical protein
MHSSAPFSDLLVKLQRVPMSWSWKWPHIVRRREHGYEVGEKGYLKQLHQEIQRYIKSELDREQLGRGSRNTSSLKLLQQCAIIR